MLTYLAIGFVVLLLAIIFYGFGIVMRRPVSKLDEDSERCSICRKSFQKKDLVERQIGDFKLLLFCGECVESLSREHHSRSPS